MSTPISSPITRAWRFYDAAYATFDQIAQMPGIGERWHSPKPRLAELRVSRIDGFENYLIFYSQAEGSVSVERVLHGARDLKGILEPES